MQLQDQTMGFFLNAEDFNMALFGRLLNRYGPRKWWPARTRFEIIAGAILTQNVSWKNARLAVNNLKKEGLLSPDALIAADMGLIAEKIISSRYYNQKAGSLKAFCLHLQENYGGSLSGMFRRDMLSLRDELLSIRGIGKETADCILLYAGKKLTFVSDAYTRRLLERYGVLRDAGYEGIRGYFMQNLPEDLYVYNEFHALIVRHGNLVCKAKPDCAACPVRRIGSAAACSYPVRLG